MKNAFSPCLFFVCLACLLVSLPAYAQETDGPYAGKKILWVDSYHQGYEWSDEIERGIRGTLAGSGVQLRVYHMDTKRNTSKEFHVETVEEARKHIQEFGPDVVIASDDNAQKLLVVPYLKDTDLPVVFCGVNWDVSSYGYPTPNVTGMVEVENVGEMVRLFQLDARGDRIGYLSGNTFSDEKIAAAFNERFFSGQMRTYFVENFTSWRSTLLQAQDEVDMLFIRNYSGIDGWNAEEAESFLVEHIKIPTGSHLAFMQQFVLYTMGKVGEEQGEFAAATALKILDGVKVSDIPLAKNSRVKLTVNLKMAKAAGIVIPVSILQTAEIINKDIVTTE